MGAKRFETKRKIEGVHYSELHTSEIDQVGKEKVRYTSGD